MQKFIVPTKDRIQKWKSFFEEHFREEEHQKALMQMLLTMVMWLSVEEYWDPRKHKREPQFNPFFELLEFGLAQAQELADTGMLDEEHVDVVGQQAYEFAVSLAAYLKELGILGTKNPVLKFEGFVGMNIIVKIFDESEIDQHGEGECLSG
ncbi:hypothetical protein AVU38_gp006 [Ralstonia phage RSL2]|uniref:Uncharacterized protein n=1 Tax=Ralstonia phage RSL2 TaxID=1585840 RepID=A0A0A8J991_9CAUD|nr:hypothetical protein AVU38_gp006 [Ralstonia phage RSL2]BAQ02534.1 hypothetical protein [Ralstonia phage RSL2]